MQSCLQKFLLRYFLTILDFGEGDFVYTSSLQPGLFIPRYTECKSHKLVVPLAGFLGSVFPQTFWWLFSHPFESAHLAA